jgi:hypothetical protein
MTMSYRITGISAIDPTTAKRIRHSMLFSAKLIFWPLVVLTLVALALQLGAWKKEFKITGPFAAETNPARHSLILAAPEQARVAWWRQPLTGDYGEKPFESILELQIDGRKMGPAHSQHETIREGKTAGFSHWGPNVIFSLPPDVKNTPETIATLRYSVRPRAWVTLVLTISVILIGGFSYDRLLRSFAQRLQALLLLAGIYAERPIAVVLRIPYLVLLGLCCLGLIGSAVYVACSLYALATGWALPTTAFIRWSPIAQWAARNEPYFGYLLLTLAGFGALMTWLAGSNVRHQRSVESNERRLRQLFVWCGFPIVAGAFIFFISAMWVGVVRSGDPNPVSIGGLVSFNDAQGHLAAAYDQAKEGTWIEFAQRRPLAAAFRSVLLFFSNDSVPVMLMLQACLFAAAACLATHAIAMWRGIWAATAFFGLVYIYTRFFVPTTLTEPLGLFWALLSVPFFIEAFRSGSVKPALVAFAMTTVALMTRMGSMFTIPALLLWLVWQFGHSTAAKLRIGVVSVGILLGVLGMNPLLQKAYGTSQGTTGGNFAFTLCGLSIGTVWTGCPARLAAEGHPLQGDEAVVAKQLYSVAWENIRARPEIFFRRLADSAEAFASQFPDVIWKGYGTYIEEPGWLFRSVLTAISLAGLLCIAARRAKPVELTFWALLWASIVASSSIVFFDDGSRILSASYPLIALFFAMGLSSPVLAPKKTPSPKETPSLSRLSRYGSLGLIVTAALFVCVPWIAYRLSPISAMGGKSLVPKRDEAFAFGGRRMSGFLVVEDGLPLRSDVPTLHLAEFEAVIEQSDVETYQGLLHPVTPPLPFGFVFAPRLELGSPSFNQFIVPADVIERRDIPAWHFQLEPWHHKPNDQGTYWLYVTKAEPWP